MSRKLIMLIGFCFILVTVAYAESPKIIKGYGLTEWGQSVEQVKKLVSGLQEVTPEKGEQWSSVKKDFVSKYVAIAQEPFKETQYLFADDKLFCINVVLSNKVLEQIGSSPIDEIVRRKYTENKDNKELLRKEGISVGVYTNKTGVVVKYEKEDIQRSAAEKIMKERETRIRNTAKELGLEDLL